MLDVSEECDISAAIETALKRPEVLMAAMNSYIDALHPYRDGRSSERVLQAVDDFEKNHRVSDLKPKPFNLWRKLQIRKRMGYYKIN